MDVQMSQVDLVKFALIKTWQMKKIALIIFVCVSLSILAVGWFWPRVYISESTILVDEYNILTPLMKGTAVATSVKDQAKNARQLLTGQYAKEQFVEFTSLDLVGESEINIDRIWGQVKYKTKIENAGKNVIRIKYKSSDPKEAQKYAAFFTDLFIDESIKDKRRESEAAYSFIAGQAEEYREKLKESEESLKNFRSENLGASPDSAGTVNARILEHQRTIEQTQLEINEIEIQMKNIKDQLSGEAAVSAHLTEEGQLQKRISALQGQLDTLRMTYLDSYPDVIIVRGQISALRMKMVDVRKQDKKIIVNAGNLNPLFQELRSNFSQLKTQGAALFTRLKATKNLLIDEKNRAIQINTVGAVLAQLTRDYDVNNDLYQKLLRQRETARVSMNIDIANQGLTLKIQEYPHVPIRPIGVRLVHIAFLGLVMAIFLPLGMAYLLVMFDGKIRSIQQFQKISNAPVLGVISKFNSTELSRYNLYWMAVVITIIVGVLSIYAYVSWLRIIS